MVCRPRGWFRNKVVRQALSLVPPKPVVDSKVKDDDGTRSRAVGNCFHHDSWQALQSQAVSLVLMVCSMLSSDRRIGLSGQRSCAQTQMAHNGG